GRFARCTCTARRRCNQPVHPASLRRRLGDESLREVVGHLMAEHDGADVLERLFDRCDRWSVVLQRLGVAQGDRVAYIAPNTHAHLEAYYAVPQIGAVLVPINYRL